MKTIKACPYCGIIPEIVVQRINIGDSYCREYILECVNEVCTEQPGVRVTGALRVRSGNPNYFHEENCEEDLITRWNNLEEMLHE